MGPHVTWSFCHNYNSAMHVTFISNFNIVDTIDVDLSKTCLKKSVSIHTHNTQNVTLLTHCQEC